MLESIRNFAKAGGVIYAECGGLIYLSKSIQLLNQEKHDLLGLFPFSIEMQTQLMALGYVTAVQLNDTFLGPKGMEMRGHQFRYSKIKEETLLDHEITYQYRLSGRKGEMNEGYSLRDSNYRILASYAHTHWSYSADVPKTFIEQVRK
jgi:cobyrinic acid a,c-diamide synthase